MSRRFQMLLPALLLALLPAAAFAAKIGDMQDNGFSAQWSALLQMRDSSLRHAMLGSLLLGVSCGLLGAFLVVRKMALVGDALSHAVLPGVAAGFLWNMSKDPWAIFIGAAACGLLGTATIHALQRWARLKEDTAIGMVLAVFFAAGIALLTMIQRLPSGNKSGIQQFLFGQAAAISGEDLRLMAIITLLCILAVSWCYKELLSLSFDGGFSSTLGLPVRGIQTLFMVLLSFSVVIALQAVGVVLVSAMLVTPAATAYLLCRRFSAMLALSALFGALAGGIGVSLSFLADGIPTGPSIVLTAGGFFTLTFLFAPQHGYIAKLVRQRSRRQRTQLENTLKAIYQVLEHNQFAREWITLEELAGRRRLTRQTAAQEATALVHAGMATWEGEMGKLLLTPSGWLRATTMVRNHRLWELYLTQEARLTPERVHDEAEDIEHTLGEEVVQRLEKQLRQPRFDPHGRPIPSLHDMWEGATPVAERDEIVGYRRKGPGA